MFIRLHFYRAILFTLSIALSYLNYRGLSIVGNAAVISTVYIIIPFAVRRQECTKSLGKAAHAELSSSSLRSCYYLDAKPDNKTGPCR